MSSFYLKLLDAAIVTFALLLIMFTINTEHHILGLDQSFFEIQSWHSSFTSFMLFALLVLLVMDLGIKYYKIRDSRKFAKKHWLDILMIVLIPIFSGFKILKIAVNLIKYLKLVKMGFKIVHKINKHT
jgi:hypothetical protein